MSDANNTSANSPGSISNDLVAALVRDAVDARLDAQRDNHVAFLERQLGHAKWIGGLLATALTLILSVTCTVFYFMVGDSADEAKSRLNNVQSIAQQQMKEATRAVEEGVDRARSGIDKVVRDVAAQVESDAERRYGTAASRATEAIAKMDQSHAWFILKQGEVERALVDYRERAQQADALMASMKRLSPSEDAVQVAQLEGFKKELSESAAVAAPPIGAIVAWPFLANPPAGWQICDGRPLNADDVAPEFRLLVGADLSNGKSDAIRTPNFANHFLRGASANHSPGMRQDWAIVEHSHKVVASSGGRQSGALSSRESSNNAGNDVEVRTKHGSIEFDPASGAGAGNVANEVRPANFAVHWIIRVK